MFDVNGKPITGVDIQRSMRNNIIAGALSLFALALTSAGMGVTMFMEAIGASGIMVGVLMTTLEFSMVAQIPSGFMADRLKCRKQFWAIMSAVSAGIWAVLAAVAFWCKPGAQWFPIAIISLVGINGFVSAGATAPWLSWHADLIPEKSAGRFWGRRQGVVTAASLVGMWFSGFILDHFRASSFARQINLHGFSVLFVIGAMASMASIIITYFGVEEPKPFSSPENSGGISRIIAPLRDKDFRHFTLGMGAFMFCVAILFPFAQLTLKRDFSISYSHLALLLVAVSLGTTATSSFAGILTDRIGPRTLTAILMLLLPLLQMSWYFVNSSIVSFQLPWFGTYSMPQVVVVQLVAFFLTGCVSGSIAPCQLRLSGVLSNPEGRTMAMAVHWGCAGLVSTLGSLAGGWLLDWFNAHPLPVFSNGTKFSALHVIIPIYTAVMWGIAIPYILSIRPEMDGIGFKEALRLFFCNPLLAARNIHNLKILTSKTNAVKRANAAQALGRGRSRLAVPDLIEQLNSPAMIVREKSVEALGLIGTPAAVEALMQKLGDTNCDLSPHIYRALGQCGQETTQHD